MTNIKKTSQIDSHDHNDDEIDLIEIIKLLWQKKSVKNLLIQKKP